MKNILLYINDDEAAEARLRTALDLTRTCGGHLICLQVTPLSAYVASDMLGGMFVMSDVIDAVQTHEDKLRTDTEARLAQEDVAWTYLCCDGDPAQTLVTHARLADVIILTRSLRQPRQGQGYLAPLAADIATSTRTPVLAVPSEIKRFDAAGAALIAWNGSTEAANALKSALPLLHLASSVSLVAVTDQESDFPTIGACEYLSRHGIEPELIEVTRGGRNVEEVLLDTVQDTGAAYLVMGAYGHSRAREFLLGGVTRHILGHSPVPVLMTH